MRAVLIANGTFSDYERLKGYIEPEDVIICADGGYDHARKLSVMPDVVIGDMDSVKSASIEAEEVVYPAKKDLTDSEIVVEYALRKGYRDLLLLGFIGTRMDHTLTNLFMLSKFPDANMLMVDEHNEIRLARKENIIAGKKGDLVSVIPLKGQLSGVTVENLEYPLHRETLYFGEGRGVSNVMTGDCCRITIDSGLGLIIKSSD